MIRTLSIWLFLVGPVVGCARTQAPLPLSAQEQFLASSERVEREIDQWAGDDANHDGVLIDLIDTSVDLEGQWVTDGFLTASNLQIQRRPSGRYDVRMYTSGCLDAWGLTRTGDFESGKLILDRPILEYSSLEYDTLYAIRVQDREYLLPKDSVRYILEHRAHNGPIVWGQRLPMSSFCRPWQVTTTWGPISIEGPNTPSSKAP